MTSFNSYAIDWIIVDLATQRFWFASIAKSQMFVAGEQIFCFALLIQLKIGQKLRFLSIINITSVVFSWEHNIVNWKMVGDA